MLRISLNLGRIPAKPPVSPVFEAIQGNVVVNLAQRLNLGADSFEVQYIGCEKVQHFGRG
jgi:hypothetical protein